jgi:hypothetical protein
VNDLNQIVQYQTYHVENQTINKINNQIIFNRKDLLMLNNQNFDKEYFVIDYNIYNHYLILPNLNHLMMMLKEDEYLILSSRMNTFESCDFSMYETHIDYSFYLYNIIPSCPCHMNDLFFPLLRNNLHI